MAGSVVVLVINPSGGDGTYAEVGKSAMDKYIANMRDASETLAKCNSQAMETVGVRLNDSLNEMCGMVKTVAARAA